MNIQRLKNLLTLGENQNIEYKSAFKSDIAGKQICAFLNSGGGYVVCGVTDKGEITGITPIDDPRSLEINVSKNISPQAFFSFELHTIDGKTVLVIEVPSGKDVPYSYSNDIYVRLGDKTQKADVDTIRDMVLRRQSEPERWERRFSDAQASEDLNYEHMSQIADLIQKFGRLKFRNVNKPDLVLEDLLLAKYGKLTNGGDVLFCKNSANRYPQVRVKAACFTSDKSDDTYKDSKYFEGPLLVVLEELYAFIIRNIPTVTHFPAGQLERQERPLYPKEAIREGLVNAFVHRDYTDFSGGLAVFIYPKRLEIWNSGELPEGVTVQGLKTGHISVLRNPDIAHVLYLRGMMEKLGRGSVLIQKACTDSGLPKPEWKSDKGVTLTFFAPEASPEAGTEQNDEGLSRDQAGTKQGPGRDQVKMLFFCKTERTIKEMMDEAKRTNRTKFRDSLVKPLLESGWLEMTDPDNPTNPKQKYRLTAKGIEVIKENDE
ncbi:MAG: putative DNA binding domain-containing protein [Spirochaetes bacterium]|nr:putative DNA binding domain-containing protein [Spirochaetota bacterium]MBN2772181.1 putative DNA binding domain-containing protein [Spirochaetota bacterium]